MDLRVTRQMIDNLGGKKWLKSLTPMSLFAYLKSYYEGDEIIEQRTYDDQSGWLLFFKIINSGEIGVKGYYYQKGDYPVLYCEKLKRLPGYNWCVPPEDSVYFDGEDRRRRDDLHKILLNIDQKGAW